MTDPDLAALINIPTDLSDDEVAEISRRLEAAAHALVPGAGCSSDPSGAESDAVDDEERDTAAP